MKQFIFCKIMEALAKSYKIRDPLYLKIIIFFLLLAGDYLRIYILLGCGSFLLFLLLTITEMVIIKLLYIIKFTMMASSDECFISNILIFCNVSYCLINVFMRFFFKEYEKNIYFSKNGVKSSKSKDINL